MLGVHNVCIHTYMVFPILRVQGDVVIMASAVLCICVGCVVSLCAFCVNTSLQTIYCPARKLLRACSFESVKLIGCVVEAIVPALATIVTTRLQEKHVSAYSRILRHEHITNFDSSSRLTRSMMCFRCCVPTVCSVTFEREMP